MKNYKFTERLSMNDGKDIDFFYEGEIKSQLTSNSGGWKTFRLSARVGDENVGYLDITNINDQDFFKNFSILKYLELYKGIDLKVDKESRILEAIGNGEKEEDEYKYKLSKEETIEKLSVLTGKFDSKKINLYSEMGMIDDVFDQLINEIQNIYGDEFYEFKQDTVKNSIVEYINVNEGIRGQGVGAALYQAAGLWCSYNDVNLTGSYNQTKSAEKTWEKLMKNELIPVKLNRQTNLYYLDYKKQLREKFNSDIFIFQKELSKFSNDNKLNKEIAMLWAKGNTEYGNLFKEDYLIKTKGSVELYFKNNVIQIDIKKASQIKKVISNLSNTHQKSFRFLNAHFDDAKVKTPLKVAL
jgi:hypothetical protein